ncbi:MAG: DUF2256 domain-containing protein [Pseudomonadota bacterium]
MAKTELPIKYCKTCARPFTWRKKWRREWFSVVYCSERCRRQRHTNLTFLARR